MDGEKRLLALLASAGVALLALTACGPPPTSKAGAKPLDEMSSVSTQKARQGDVSRIVTVTGSLAALQDVPLSAKQPGRLVDVTVREGDTVSAGQVLARVDDSDLRRQTRSAEAAVASALARVRQTEAAYAQQKTTSEASVAAAQASYAQQVATSAASEQSAESALKAARSNLSALQEGARVEERQQTQAALRVAEANSRKAEADLKRYQRLHDAGAISDGELDQIVTARDVATANLQAAQAVAEMQRNGSRRQDIEQAQERVRQAEETLRQAHASRAQDAVRKADLDTAIAGKAQNRVRLADVETARAALRQSQTSLAVARQAVADAVVTAPFAGRVSARLAEPGQVVTSATVLVKLVSSDGAYFEPSVPEDQVQYVHVGQRVDVSADSAPGPSINGTVSRIYPTSTSSSRTVTIRVTVPSGRGVLRPQAFAVGRIYTSTHPNVVLVPKAAVGSGSGGAQPADHVFTVEGGVAREHKVTVGLESSDTTWVEVTGIQANADVVVEGLSGLVDGAKVSANDHIAAR